MTNIKQFLTVNYVYIILIIMWVIIQNFIGVDAKGRVPFFFSVLYLVICLRFHRKELFSKPLSIWWCWVVYSLINTFFIHQSASENHMGLVTEVVSCPLMVCAVIVEYKKNASQCLSCLGIILSVFVLLCLMKPLDAMQLDSRTHGISAYGNAVPLTILVAISIYSIKYIRSELSLRQYVMVAIMAIALIFFSATRKAFGGCIIIFFFTYLASLKSLSIRSLIFPIIVFLALIVFADYLENSLMMNRFEDLEDTDNYYANNTFLKLLGDRAFMYVEGWALFQDNPVSGIGLMNFYSKGYSTLMLHTEYMVQLVECGIIGSLLFVWFYANIVKRLWAIVKIAALKYEAIINLGCVVALLFISLTAWTYSIPLFFIYIGLIISFIQVSEENLYNSK